MNKIKKPLAAWRTNGEYNGGIIFQTGFPQLYGTEIAICNFQPRKIMSSGDILDKNIKQYGIFAAVDPRGREVTYSRPDASADTKLSLSCAFEGDCTDWDANSAYFLDGKLMGFRSFIGDEKRHAPLPVVVAHYNLDKTIQDLYKQEFRGIARHMLKHEGTGDPFAEFVAILKADSPQGKGLHDFYRERIKSVLGTQNSEEM